MSTLPTDPLEASLEKIFQKLEQESERRALDEQKQEIGASQGLNDVPRRSACPTARGSKVAIDTASNTLRVKDRRRGSVSISIFGQPSDYTGESSGSASPAPVSPLASAGSKSTLYHSLANPKSVDTLPIDQTIDEGIPDAEEDEHHVTRMQTITGRHLGITHTVNKMGALLSRTSTRRNRIRSSTVAAPSVSTTEVVIGISVEATVEAEHSGQDHHVAVYADRTNVSIRRRTSWLGVRGGVKGTFATKAKGFAQKFNRRKSYSDFRVSESLS